VLCFPFLKSILLSLFPQFYYLNREISQKRKKERKKERKKKKKRCEDP
jgi:hypothetical protein